MWLDPVDGYLITAQNVHDLSISDGIQAKLSEMCGRFILYIHCVNHRLHLVIKKILVKKVNKEGEAVETDDVRIEVQDFFEMVGGLYTFFKLDAVKELYTGRLTLKRLITTRWSGHLAAVKVTITLYTRSMILVLCLYHYAHP